MVPPNLSGQAGGEAPPTVTCPSNILAQCAGGLTQVFFEATSADSMGNPLSVTCVPPSGTGFRLGTSNVVCSAPDGLGGLVSCTFTVTVVDTVSPNVTCSANITTGATSPAGAVVNYIASASDACGLASFDCAPASGSTFPIGLTTVICEATDRTGLSNSCSFLITVFTNECPVASNLTVSVEANSSVSFQLPASDPNGNPLQFSITSPPAHGVIVVQTQTGAATYTPTRAYCGPDSFKFKVNDGQCDSAEATVTINIPCTARVLKADVLSEIIALRAIVTRRTDQDRLSAAIGYLTAALAPALWVDDTHLVPKHGDRVFQFEEDAVNKLRDLIGDHRSDIPAATLLDWIARLVQADRLLAVISVDEAEAAGAPPAKIAQDREQIASGDADAAADRPINAIEHYRNAWKHAVQLVVHVSAQAGGGGMTLSFLAMPRRDYVIESSANLVDWTAVETVTADANGVVEYRDGAAPASGARFFRVVVP